MRPGRPDLPDSARPPSPDLSTALPVAAFPDCPILVTSELVLRPPHEDDVDAIALLANNPAIATMVSRMPSPYGRADAVAFLRKSGTRTKGNCIYAITEAETGAFTGCCGIETHADDGVTEIGYWIGEPYWGRGYATEAVHALVDMAFSTRDIAHIDARCRVTNTASRRVLQKSGFQFQGSGMVPIMALSASVAVDRFRLDRKTWASLIGWSGKHSRTA